MKNVKIRRTDNYEELVPFFIENRLEFSEEEPVPTDIVECWNIKREDGKILAGMVLALREGEYICDGLAVDSSIRGLGFGRKMTETLIGKAKDEGAKSVFLVARAPEVFKAMGFVPVKRENAPYFFECFTCPQYGNECHPEVLKYEIEVR